MTWAPFALQPPSTLISRNNTIACLLACLGPVRPAASLNPRAEPSIMHAQVRIGTVGLGTLHEGEAELLSSEELERLLALTQR